MTPVQKVRVFVTVEEVPETVVDGPVVPVTSRPQVGVVDETFPMSEVTGPEPSFTGPRAGHDPSNVGRGRDQ